MIVADLDGTLLNENSRVSNTTKEYLKRLKDMGYIIVIATGRIYDSALNATDGAEFANYLITDTGSFTYDMSNLKSIFKKCIDKKVIEKLFGYYNDDFRYIYVCDKKKYYKYSDDVGDSDVVITTKDKNFILNNCSDISHASIALKSNEAVMNLYQTLLNDIKEVDLIIMQDSFSSVKWIEILPKNASKYNAISDLANLLNINNDDIICFGDGLNDIDMLKRCGQGVAMNNALMDVKKISDAVTVYDNNHDGVINYLKEYLDVK